MMTKKIYAETRALKFQRNLVLGRALTAVSAMVWFFVFLGCPLGLSLFGLPINKVFAVGLEVQYPAVPGANTPVASTTLPDYVLYLFKAGMFIGFFVVFISLAIAGAMWLFSPAKPDFLADAKDRVSEAISGLLILVLTYLIITTINPQLINAPQPAEQPTAPQPTTAPTPGIYFYKGAGCPNTESSQPNISSVKDLGNALKPVNSVGIVDTSSGSSYMAILYSNPNFWGKCQYIVNTSSSNQQFCKIPVSLFASSASIYQYDYNHDGAGVYFYRRSYFDPSGGYFEVSDNDITSAGGIYTHALNDPSDPLTFNNVPKNEQDCVKYDDNGNCIGRSPPSLGGQNISSISIQGNYLVLLVYFDPKNDSPDGPWTSCQEFPAPDDVNRIGPAQIKWQNIMNSSDVLPNYVVIIPIQQQ